MTLMVFAFLVAGSEVALTTLFSLLTPDFLKKRGLDWKSILKGWIERLFLFVALVHGYPHVLTVFSALKLATRLKRDDDQDKAGRGFNFNDFYLLGNFLSVMAAIIYVYWYSLIK